MDMQKIFDKAKKITQSSIIFVDRGVAYLISFCCLLFCCAPFNLWEPDLRSYDIELLLADQIESKLTFFFFVLMALHCFERRQPYLRYTAMVVWIGFFVLAPYLIHQIPSIQKTYKVMLEDIHE